MAENKTQPTSQPVAEFLAAVEPQRRRDEGLRLAQLMGEVTGEPGVMWGSSIVGFGEMRYRYASGREGDWMKVGFSPRKAQLSLYGLKDHHASEPMLAQLGPHTTGAGCIYIKRLDEIDENVLRALVSQAYQR